MLSYGSERAFILAIYLMSYILILLDKKKEREMKTYYLENGRRDQYIKAKSEQEAAAKFLGARSANDVTWCGADEDDSDETVSIYSFGNAECSVKLSR